MPDKKKLVVDPEVKRKQYWWAGGALFALGCVFSLLNFSLRVPEYQDVSHFTAFFFAAGGGLGLVVGAPSREGRWAHLWKAVTAAVVIAFGICIADLLHSETQDPTSLMLVVAVFGAYFLFLYLIHLKPSAQEQLAKHIETAEVLVVAISLAIGIKAAGVQAFKIPSGSMLHTLEIGDHLLVSKFLYGIPLPYTDARLPGLRDPKRGDIVVFAYPGFDNPDRPAGSRPGYPDQLKGQDFIKRIIGMPGDTVEIRQKRLYINGEPANDPWGQFLDEAGRPLADPYAWRPRDAMPDYGPAKVPEGMYLAMGDNRNHSNDGRAWGFVRKGRIKGKAFVIYWSWPDLKRIGTLID